MKAQAIFLDCPAYLDKDGATRCGLPAEMEARYTIGSTDGPLDSAKIRCPRGHWSTGRSSLSPYRSSGAWPLHQ